MPLTILVGFELKITMINDLLTFVIIL